MRVRTSVILWCASAVASFLTIVFSLADFANDPRSGLVTTAALGGVALCTGALYLAIAKTRWKYHVLIVLLPTAYLTWDNLTRRILHL